MLDLFDVGDVLLEDVVFADHAVHEPAARVVDYQHLPFSSRRIPDCVQNEVALDVKH